MPTEVYHMFCMLVTRCQQILNTVPLTGFLFFLRVGAEEEEKLEVDEKFWELLMSADKKDYESICTQYGITDFRWMLKKLNEMKVEKEKEQEKVQHVSRWWKIPQEKEGDNESTFYLFIEQVAERVCNLRAVELNSIGELQLETPELTSKIFLYKVSSFLYFFE